MNLAVIFPGIGYHCDKPLLYYSKKLIRDEYKIIEVHYAGSAQKAKSDQNHLESFYKETYHKTVAFLDQIQFSDYEDILFISKSIGTAISEKYAREKKLRVRSVLFTPLAYTYEGASSQAIAFHGTNDPWADTDEIIRLSRLHNVPLTLIDGANHSLETGDALKDIKSLYKVMDQVKAFINDK